VIRRVRRMLPSSGAHADETPEYWVTYSDLLVSLLVVFALLLFVALARIESERRAGEKGRTAVRETIETTGRAVGAAAEAMGDSSSVQYDARTRTLTVRDEVLFDFGSDRLRPEGVKLVRAVGVRFVPRLLSDTVVDRNIEAIVVEGHTDTVGTYLSNLGLSQRRAQNVMRTLVETTYGLDYAPRLRELLVASGRSEVEALEAVSNGRYDDARARRIVLRVRLRDEELLRRLLGEEDTVSVLSR
jgi:chemotaxis protein MotB